MTLLDEARQYSLVDALLQRRSRRFGLGMEVPAGPFAYRSHREPMALSEEEEAMLAFAACGLTGFALADLSYGQNQGGQMLAGLLGRSIASADAVNTAIVFVSNDQATYLIKRPQDYEPDEYSSLLRLGAEGDFLELYRRSRVLVRAGRTAPSLEPGVNYTINRWSLYRPGSTYFLPVSEMTQLYINAILESFDESMGLFILDERAGFQPAGIRQFGKSRGGHLSDDPASGRLATIEAVEASLGESLGIEQGMALQNLGLMAQALGLGGFPNFAYHPYAWLQALGFRMQTMAASRYLGANRLISRFLGLLGKDRPVPYAVGLELDGEVLVRPFCPPYYASMEAAVMAVVDLKFGMGGVFRAGAAMSPWKDPAQAQQIPRPSEQAIQATIAYCEYIYRRYGRFPAYKPPFRTGSGFQAVHLDPEFYARFFRPEALTENQRSHLEAWHAQKAQG